MHLGYHLSPEQLIGRALRHDECLRDIFEGKMIGYQQARTEEI